ncbi:MAG: hypothetical protein LBJ43_00525 [Propionibacteriaceae bacterium]|jgi:hypothetical protein|nr:hypothetical protein [Propionibacteriaceae bacterium]
MSIQYAQPTIWSAALLANLHANVVYSQAGVINTDYEGDIANEGDTVKITSVVSPAVRPYTKNTDITFDVLDDASSVLQITQSEYFAFQVDDVDARQAKPNFIPGATAEAAQKLALTTDAFVATKMAAGVAAGNQLGDVNVDPANPGSAYKLIIQLRSLLVKSFVPVTNRWLIVPPELYAVLLQDDRFIRADAAGTTEGLRNGQVGKIAGFTVFESTEVPEDEGVYTVLAGSPIATTYAEQISKTEFTRLEKRFADGVKGLHLYGASVIRPSALASALVSIETPEPPE